MGAALVCFDRELAALELEPIVLLLPGCFLFFEGAGAATGRGVVGAAGRFSGKGLVVVFTAAKPLFVT
jgi:hypothetical protein